MTRIGGGGPPIVPPGAGQTQQTQKADAKTKAQEVQQPQQATESAQSEQAKKARQSELTGKVKDLAKRFANGQTSQKEATREFVSLVIEERFPQFKRKKRDGDEDEEEDNDEEAKDPEELLEEAVTELIVQDPALAKKLSSQFKKLAKG